MQDRVIGLYVGKKVEAISESELREMQGKLWTLHDWGDMTMWQKREIELLDACISHAITNPVKG